MNPFHKIKTKISIRRFYVFWFKSTKFDGQIYREIDAKFKRNVKNRNWYGRTEKRTNAWRTHWIYQWIWPGIIIIRKCRRIEYLLQDIVATKTNHARNRPMLQIPQLTCSISHNTPFSQHKYAHLCSKLCSVRWGTNALWEVRIMLGNARGVLYE